MPTASRSTVERLLDVGRIYYEPAVLECARGREILDRFSGAERIEVPAHNNVPGLFGNEGAVRDWIRIKRTVLVLGVRKTLTIRPNERSADFIAPSQANGCAMACAYCYVPRHKGFANPITTFVNIEAIVCAIERHALRRGPKPGPSQADPQYWTYDIGENSDCSADAVISNNVRDLVGLFRRLPHAKATFATKLVNPDLLGYDPHKKTRIRFSLMPEQKARLLDVRTSPVAERIGAINDFVAAGYEVNLNFSPVVLYDGWRADYAQLFEQIDQQLSGPAREQLAAEIIFLTHNERLHEVNVVWHPKAEALLWRPELQEAKVSETGGRNVRYRSGVKGARVREFCALLHKHLPYCVIRYAF